AGGGEEFRGLGADHRKVVVLGGGGVLRSTELHHLPLGNDGGGRRQDFQRPERGHFDHHLEGFAQQKIADQHACLVTPQHASGELAPPHFAFVYDVVVQQRRRVHEFHGGGELDVAGAGITGEPGHGEG